MEAAQASGATLTPNWFALAGSGNRSLWSGKGGAAAKVVPALRRELRTDDVEHMIFDCSSLEVNRQKHQALFARGSVDLADFFEQDPIELLLFSTAV